MHLHNYHNKKFRRYLESHQRKKYDLTQYTRGKRHYLATSDVSKAPQWLKRLKVETSRLVDVEWVEEEEWHQILEQPKNFITLKVL